VVDVPFAARAVDIEAFELNFYHRSAPQSAASSGQNLAHFDRG